MPGEHTDDASPLGVRDRVEDLVDLVRVIHLNRSTGSCFRTCGASFDCRIVGKHKERGKNTQSELGGGGGSESDGVSVGARLVDPNRNEMVGVEPILMPGVGARKLFFKNV